MMRMNLTLLCSCVLLVVPSALSWGTNKDRVLLTDVGSITLEAGRMTNGRRSSPVPQLTCVGGTAGRSAPQPKVVQCLNRGSNGYDVQWECKADMDYDYRFGRVEVSCEGYDNANDPYILRGSCGLEYELDLTEQGQKTRQHGDGYHDNYYGNQHRQHQGGYNTEGTFRWGKLVSLVIMGTVAYWLVKCCCFSGRTYTPTPSGTTTGSGFTSTSTTSAPAAGGGGGGGFWTGAATGGLLGYLFGNNRGGGYGGYGRGWGGGYGSSWGRGYTSRSYGGGSGWGSGGGSSFRSSSSGSRSSGSRTTSGFGGTSRR